MGKPYSDWWGLLLYEQLVASATLEILQMPIFDFELPHDSLHCAVQPLDSALSNFQIVPSVYNSHTINVESSLKTEIKK